MAWMIVSEDSELGPKLRADATLMAAHWQYELSIRDRILAADPATQAGLRGRITIRYWNPAILDGEPLD